MVIFSSLKGGTGSRDIWYQIEPGGRNSTGVKELMKEGTVGGLRMRNKRFKGGKRAKYLAFLILAAVIITCFAYPYFYSALLKSEFNPNNLIRVSDFKDYQGARQEFAVFSGSLVSLKGKHLKLQTGDGRTLWQREVSLKQPFITALSEIIVVADVEGSTIYGISSEGEDLWEAKPAGSIIRMGVDKEHIWMRTQHEDLAIVEVLDQNGKEAAYLQVGGAEVTGVSVSWDGSFIAVSTAGVKEGGITGSVILYKKDGAIAWAKSYSNSLVMGVSITDNGDILVLTERMLYSLSTEGSINWQREVSGYIAKALITDDGITALTLSEDYRSGIPGGVKEETLMYDNNGNNLARIVHSDRIKGLVEGQGHIGIYAERSLRVVPLSGGDVIIKEFDRDLMALYLLEEDFLAYISAGKIYFEPVNR
jgi:hypothetical protein